MFFNASIQSAPDTACVDLDSILRTVTSTSGGKLANVSHLSALTLQLAWARSEGDTLCDPGAAYLLESLLAALVAGFGSDDERLDVGQFSGGWA